MSMMDAELRDYFAAHAPEIPEWFDGPRLPFPVRPTVPEEIAEAVRAWQLEDDVDDLEDYLSKDAPVTHFVLARQYQADLSAYFEARSNREKDVAASRFFVWRWYYAEMMLRHKPDPPGCRPYKPLERS